MGLLPRKGGLGVAFWEWVEEDPRRPRDRMKTLLLGAGLQWELGECTESQQNWLFQVSLSVQGHLTL